MTYCQMPIHENLTNKTFLCSHNSKTAKINYEMFVTITAQSAKVEPLKNFPLCGM